MPDPSRPTAPQPPLQPSLATSGTVTTAPGSATPTVINLVQHVPVPPQPTPAADVARRPGGMVFKAGRWVDANGNPIEELEREDEHLALPRPGEAQRRAAVPPPPEDPFNNPVAAPEAPPRRKGG